MRPGGQEANLIVLFDTPRRALVKLSFKFGGEGGSGSVRVKWQKLKERRKWGGGRGEGGWEREGLSVCNKLALT